MDYLDVFDLEKEIDLPQAFDSINVTNDDSVIKVTGLRFNDKYKGEMQMPRKVFFNNILIKLTVEGRRYSLKLFRNKIMITPKCQTKNECDTIIKFIQDQIRNR